MCDSGDVDLNRPLRVITPTLDGDILAVLAAGRVKLTGRAISRKVGASQEGTRKVLERLVDEGVVLKERAGNAHLYQLNRRHLAAPSIERLASLRMELIDRLRTMIRNWRFSPVLAALFGSVARGESQRTSDIDILVIRPSQVDADQPAWRRQIDDLQSSTSALTGNDARVLEYSYDEVRRLRGKERVLVAAAADGIELFGSLRSLRARGSAEKRGR